MHCAAAEGHTDVVRALLEAAPHTAMVQADNDGPTPLECALFAEQPHVKAARCLLTAGPADNVLAALWAVAYEAAAAADEERTSTVLSLVADGVAAHTPLSDAEWAQVPTPCPGLGAALPIVLARSAAQAAHLVTHLPAEGARCLRTAALCLARAQRKRPPCMMGACAGVR